MNTPANSSPRWENYLLHHGAALTDFWTDYLAAGDRKVMFVLGRGFDPRMCLGIERLFSLDGIADAIVRVVDFDEGENSPSVKFAPRVSAMQLFWTELLMGKA